jgi:type IV pilus assembly protein PilW
MSPARSRPSGAAQRGLTLIELLITMVISLAVLAIVSYAYLGTRGAYRTNEGVARVQESGRFAIDSIARDLRRTSFLGCGSVTTALGAGLPAVQVTPGVAAIDYGGGVGSVAGFTNNWDATAFRIPATPTVPPASWPPNNWVPTTDVLVVRMATSSPAPIQVLAPAGGGPTGQLIADGAVCGGLNPGNSTMLVVSSCTVAKLITVLNGGTSCPNPGASYAGNPVTVNYSAPVPLTGTSPSMTVDGYLTAAQFDEVTYFVGTNGSGSKSLYRHSAVTGAVDEVVDGIESLGLQFGVATNPGQPTDATTSMQLAPGAPQPIGAANSPNFANVVSIQVAVQAVGGEISQYAAGANGPPAAGFGATNQAVTFAQPLVLGQPLVAIANSDSRLRDRFSTTIALRNRMN